MGNPNYFGTPWEHTLDVSEVFYHGDDEAEVQASMVDVAKVVEKWANAMFPTDWHLESAADELVDAAEAEDWEWWNAAWDEVYDWADMHRVWIKTRK